MVRSAQLREDVTVEVAEFAATLGLSMQAVVASPLPGPSGNVEYFLWLKKTVALRRRRLRICAT